MFERYTESARRALFFSRYEASELRRLSIETEHLLLGLLRGVRGLTRDLFADAHLSYDEIVEKMQTTTGEKLAVSVEIPFSEQTKRALHAAAEESDRLGHAYIGTEHLLLGLLGDEHSVAGSILATHGLHLDPVRKDIAARLAAAPPEDAARTLVADDIARIKTLLSQMSQREAHRPEVRTLVERIFSDLDALASHLR
jgi:ATP-dependent Clp protease ATP-binding subunit ClpC